MGNITMLKRNFLLKGAGKKNFEINSEGLLKSTEAQQHVNSFSFPVITGIGLSISP